MLVRALHSFVSPHGTAIAGDRLDVSPDVAAEWLRVGLVERAEVVQMATRSAPERALARRGRR